MRTLPFLTFVALMLALALALPSVSAQSGTVDSKINVGGDTAVAGQLKPGDPASNAILSYELCYGQGGFNPQSGTFTLDLAASNVPDWLTVNIVDTQISFTPASSPAAAAACVDGDPSTSQIEATVGQGAPNGTSATFSIDFTVGGPAEAGTVKKPAPPSPLTITVNLAAIADTDIPNPGDDDGTGTTGTGASGGESTEDSPAPVPALFVTTSLLVLAFLRRRD